MGSMLTVNGQVAATLVSTTSVGAATLGVEGLTVSGDTAINFVPGPAANALIIANPTSRVVSLAGTIALTVTVTDQFGNVVTPTTVSMGSSLGVLDSSDSIVTKTTAANTGLLNAVLTSTVAGTDTLILSSEDGSIAIDPASDDILFLPDVPLSVTIEPPGPIVVRINVPQVITASSRDQFGNAVDPWTPVEYTWHQNSAGGAAGYGILQSLDEDYFRRINFFPPRSAGNMLWTTGGVETSEMLAVTVLPGYPNTATAAVSPASVSTDVATPFTVTLTNVKDVYGNLLQDGEVLTVTVNSSPQLVVTGTLSGGVLKLPFASNTYAGTHLIQAIGADGTVSLSGQTSVQFLPGEPVRAHIDANPELLPADGVSESALVITVRDANLNLVQNNIPITVTSNLGTITGAGSTINGKVNRTLIAPALLGTAGFIVEAPGAGLPFVTGDTVVFGIGDPAIAVVNADPARVIADGVRQSTLAITVTDVSGYVVKMI